MKTLLTGLAIAGVGYSRGLEGSPPSGALPATALPLSFAPVINVTQGNETLPLAPCVDAGSLEALRATGERELLQSQLDLLKAMSALGGSVVHQAEIDELTRKLNELSVLRFCEPVRHTPAPTAFLAVPSTEDSTGDSYVEVAKFMLTAAAIGSGTFSAGVAAIAAGRRGHWNW